MIDVRFPTALQAVLMVAAATEDGVRATSRTLAEGLGANPSFVRRLIRPLGLAGILASAIGQNGGLRLARAAEDITLRDIYEAVIEDKKLWASRPGVPNRCFISSNITTHFEAIAESINAMVLEHLDRLTVASSLRELRAQATRQL
ncbi:Rrf2 family transcriptional repressor of oqxAB [Bradyrhizobium sp. USDA 4449]